MIEPQLMLPVQSLEAIPMLIPDDSFPTVFAETQHLRRTTWPIAWAAKTASLNRSFEALKQVALADYAAVESDAECGEPSITPTVLMLGGLAIENLLKGLIAKADKISQEKGKPKFKEHGLVALAATAGVTLSDDELVLLQRLTEFVLWAGRYPASQKADVLRIHTRKTAGSRTLTSMMIPKDFEDASLIIVRLSPLLDS